MLEKLLSVLLCLGSESDKPKKKIYILIANKPLNLDTCIAFFV